jgi:phosphoribosylglycinamide formyltransferase-1
LASGGGSNLGAILQARSSGQMPNVDVVLVLSNKADAAALERARRFNIPTAVVEHKAYAAGEDFQAAILEKLIVAKADVVALAGYLKKIGDNILKRYPGRIINIHPALLPKFGGPGMYGHFVHEAVLQAGEKESGCTVHVVDQEFDHGPILAQVKVPVFPGDTPDLLAARVLEQEHQLYPKTIKEFCEKLARSGVRS